MTLNLNPQAPPVYAEIANDAFLTGTPGDSIQGRVSSDPAYTWSVLHGDLRLASGGGVFSTGDGMACLPGSGYGYGFTASFTAGTDFSTASFGMVYGMNFNPLTMEKSSRFFGVKEDRLVVYSLFYVEDGTSPVLNVELYDLGEAGLAAGESVALQVIRDGWYTQFLRDGEILAEICDTSLYTSGNHTAEGIYIVSADGEDGPIATSVSYGQYDISAVKERQTFLMPFYAVSENCAESNRTPLYNPCHAYAMTAQTTHPVNEDVEIQVFQGATILPDLVLTIPSGGQVASMASGGSSIGLVSPLTFTTRLATLDDSFAGITTVLEVVPDFALDPINSPTFSGAYRLVDLAPTTSPTDLDGLYPRLNTSLVNAAAAKFTVVDGSASLDGDTLSLDGMAMTNIQSDNAVLALHWALVDYLPAGEYGGIAFGCTATGSGYALVLYGTGSNTYLRIYELAAGVLGALVHDSDPVVNVTTGGFNNLMVGIYGAWVHVSWREEGSLVGPVLREYAVSLALPGTYGGLIGNTADMTSFTFTAYIGYPHIVIGGSFMSYDNFGVPDNDAGDTNYTTPYSLEHREVVDGNDEKYTWQGATHSENPITTGVTSPTITQTGTQGVNGQTLRLLPTATVPQDDAVYHQYGLKRPFYLNYSGGG